MGIMILIQGEKFRPHEIEKEVEKTIIEFLNEIKKLDHSEFLKIVRTKINNVVEFSDDMSEVASSIYTEINQ